VSKRKSKPKPEAAAALRNRIKGHRRVVASELVPHPLNWRTHPAEQRDAMRGLFAELGFARSLLAYEMEDGRLGLIDGHLRQELLPDEVVTVEVLDLTPAEVAKLLATLDPVSALAGADAEKLDALLREVQTADPAVAEMLDQLAQEHGVVPVDDGPAEQTELNPTTFAVIVECADEAQQAGLLERFAGEGLKCRALIA
jgi:transposase